MKTTLAFTAAALTLATLGLASAAGAQDGPGRRGEGPQAQEAHWRDPHGGGDHDRWGHGRDVLRRFEAFDLNDDDAITQAEIDQFRRNQITEFDANGDGTLSLEEYQALWLDAMRERMVDAFQEHDDDGDGQVTADEFNERYADLVDRFDRNGDGQLSAEDRRGDRGMGRRPDDAGPRPGGAAPGTTDSQQ